MRYKKKFVAVLMLLAVILCTDQVSISASAKSAPQLSISDTIRITKKVQKAVKLKGAGNSKVVWTIRENDYCRKYKKPSVKIVRKSNKEIVIKPVHNGVGTILCKVGKKTVSVDYDVFLKKETLNKTKNLSNDALFKKFISGEIPVIYNDTKNLDWVYYQILKKNVDSDSISVNSKMDLDNDGEDEYIIGDNCWELYGGMYIDAYKGSLRVLAYGDGMASELSHTSFKNTVWVVHSDLTHYGRQYYILEKYNGDEKVEDMIRIGAEYEDSKDGTYNESSRFYYNDKNISMKEYESYLRGFHLIDQ